MYVVRLGQFVDPDAKSDDETETTSAIPSPLK